MSNTNIAPMLMNPKDTNWYFFTLPAFLGTKTLLDTYLVCSILAAFLSLAFLTWALSTGGGIAWTNGRNCRGRVHIPGPRGFPVVGSLLTLGRGLAHCTLASMAWSQGCTQLMALSLGGTTPLVVASDPTTAREILTSSGFADRPIKQSAKSLMFERAIGFAPNGTYWRLLRRIASTHLLSPRRISAHEGLRQAECTVMLQNIIKEVGPSGGTVSLRSHLQLASLNNIMGTVFGKRYDVVEDRVELNRLEEMVREGFDLLGAFNWSDYLPWLSWFYDPFRVNQRCSILVPRVKELVKGIIEEHRGRGPHEGKFGSESGDFVDVLLSLEGEEKLEEDDMISVLWHPVAEVDV
ncbi:Cytochrome P450 78A7 [Linum perenne]